MSDERLTPFEGYVRKVLARLGGLSAEQRDTVAAELRAHLADAAQAAGRDPEDAALQRELIGRLGPARRLGRELALARMSPAQRQARPWLFVGAIGLLLAPLLIALAFVIPEEEASEFVFILSQSPMIFAVPAVFMLCRPYAPRLSLLALAIGLFGNSLLPALALADLLGIELFAGGGMPDTVSVAWLSLPPLWQLMAAGLALLRDRRLPPAERAADKLLAPALLGGGTGLVLLLFYTVLLVPIHSLATPIIPILWLVMNGAWSLFMATMLFLSTRSAARPPLDEPRPTR